MSDQTPKAAPEGTRLRKEVEHLRKTLGSLIAWMAQSANSPISVKEAERLLRMLDRESS